MEIIARWYETGAPMRICIEGARVAEAARVDAAPGGMPWLAPGLLDMQINGYRGQEFSSDRLTVERCAEIVDAMAAFELRGSSRRSQPIAWPRSPARCERSARPAARTAGSLPEWPASTSRAPISRCRMALGARTPTRTATHRTGMNSAGCKRRPGDESAC